MIKSERIVEITKKAYEFRKIFSQKHEDGYNFFLKEWKRLSKDEKEIMSPSIINHLEYLKSGMDATISPIRNSYCQTILNIIKNDSKGIADYGEIKLKKGIKPIDIAVIFKILFDLKYFESSLDEIEYVVIKTFKLRQNKTLKSYFKNPSKLKTAANKFKGKLEVSDLLRK